MPFRCCVPHCRGNYRNTAKVSVFGFPEEEDLRRQWLSAIARKDFVPTKSSKAAGKVLSSLSVYAELTSFEELGLDYDDCCVFSPHKYLRDEKVFDREWFLKFRAGVNLFNLFPERGIHYFIEEGFLADCPTITACFLLRCKGLNKCSIGRFLANEQDPFSISVLQSMAQQMKFTSLTIDEALRNYQKHFLLSGNSSKVETMLEVFSHRYSECSEVQEDDSNSPRTVMIVAYAILLLNADLNYSKSSRKMTKEEFCLNIQTAYPDENFNKPMLEEIYTRVRKKAFKTGWDNAAEIDQLKVYSKKEKKRVKKNLSESHRRLVYCCHMHCPKGLPEKYRRLRLKIVVFNDILAILKEKRRGSLKLLKLMDILGLAVNICQTSATKCRICLSDETSGDVLLILDAKDEVHRRRFVFAVKEMIMEMELTARVFQEYRVQNRLPLSMLKSEDDEKPHQLDRYSI